MNWDVIQGDWKQFKGKVQQRWNKLSDVQLDAIAGKREQLAGKIAEAYGTGKDEVERQIKEFEVTNKDYRPAQSSPAQPS